MESKATLVDNLMARLLVTLEFPQAEKLVEQALITEGELRRQREQILARMKPDEPPQTEKMAFGSLKDLDRFRYEGEEYMMVWYPKGRSRGEFTGGAVALTGANAGYLDKKTFLATTSVEKIIIK